MAAKTERRSKAAAPEAGRALIAELRRELARAADPAKAGPMQAYMKSAMPYYGVPAPAQRKISKALFAKHVLPDAAAWRATVLALWRDARRREERYAAIELTGQRYYREWLTLNTLPIFEEMIVTGGWWDYVDAIASHRLGELLRRYPRPMKRTLRTWSRDQNLWKRRSAILSQLTFKVETDLEFLYACIEPNFADHEFFIRKAIGWALRQYAWTDPKEIARYLKEQEARLSPLSRREARKNFVPPPTARARSRSSGDRRRGPTS